MKPICIRFLFGLALAILLSGCATSRHAEQRQGRGMQQPFRVPFERAWEASIDAVYANGLTILRTNLNREGGVISAERVLNLRSPGENVTIRLTPLFTNETVLAVRNEPKVPMLRIKNWESPLLASLALDL